MGNNAFKSLNSLHQLVLVGASFDYIPEYAFNFENSSETTLQLYLDGCNNLNGSSFASNSLSLLKRPTTLNLRFSSNKLTFLKQTVFKPFLLANQQNVVNLGIDLDCNDCRSYWLTHFPEVEKRFRDIRCGNGNLLNDKRNFINC